MKEDRASDDDGWRPPLVSSDIDIEYGAGIPVPVSNSWISIMTDQSDLCPELSQSGLFDFQLSLAPAHNDGHSTRNWVV